MTIAGAKYGMTVLHERFHDILPNGGGSANYDGFLIYPHVVPWLFVRQDKLTV
jgi:hypothetical protein